MSKQITRYYKLHVHKWRPYMFQINNCKCPDMDDFTCKKLKTKRRRSDSVLWQKPLHPRNMSKGQWQHKQRHKKVRLNSGMRTDFRTVSWSNYSHPTGVVYRFYRAHLPTHRNSCVFQGQKHANITLQWNWSYKEDTIFKGFSSGKTALLERE